MKKSRLLVFLPFLILSLPLGLFSQSYQWKSVRVWDSELANFGPNVDLGIQGGKVQSIKPTTSLEVNGYIVPGYCDASVTLGANGLGGRTGKAELPQRLGAFLRSGFSHLELVGDPDLTSLQTEILRKKWNAPNLSQAQKPRLSAEGFPEGVSNNYDLAGKRDTRRSVRLPFFLKEGRLKGFSQTELYSERERALRERYLPVAYTFADKTSWEDALDTGYTILFHPMPPKTNLRRSQKRDFLWSPMLATLYLQDLLPQKENYQNKVEEWKEKVPAFKEGFADFAKSLDPAPDEEDRIPFAKYADTFRDEKEARQNLLFASGTGHYGLFPGQAAYVETKLWEEGLLAASPARETVEEESSTGFWFFSQKDRKIQKPHRDPETLSRIRREILQILTKQTCTFLGAEHGGRVVVGGPAHFSVHTKNPLLQGSTLFAIESMVVGGKLVYSSTLRKEGSAK